jgi:hypothetical protein
VVGFGVLLVVGWFAPVGQYWFQAGHQAGGVHVELAGQVDEDSDRLVGQAAGGVVAVEVVWVDAEQVAQLSQRQRAGLQPLVEQVTVHRGARAVIFPASGCSHRPGR